MLQKHRGEQDQDDSLCSGGGSEDLSSASNSKQMGENGRLFGFVSAWCMDSQGSEEFTKLKGRLRSVHGITH